MASSIDPADLPRHIDAYGHRATVVTVGGDGRPHVGTSLVEVDGDRLRITVGPSAAGYLRDHPDLCLTWTPPAGEQYQLIVDGRAADVSQHGDTFRVTVALTAGIRHRVADAPGSGPSCIALGDT